MSLQVCKYPHCKAIGLLEYCEAHRELLCDEDDECVSEPQPREGVMKGETCTKGLCENEAAEDSVMCPKHRDLKKAMNARYQGKDGKPKRAYHRRAVVAQEPGPCPGPVPGEVVPVPAGALADLDEAIAARKADLAVLERAKEILIGQPS